MTAEPVTGGSPDDRPGNDPVHAGSGDVSAGSAADRLVARFRRQAIATARAAGTGRVPAAERVIQRIRNGIEAVAPGAGDRWAQEMRYAVLTLLDPRTHEQQYAAIQPVLGREKPGWLLARGHPRYEELHFLETDEYRQRRSWETPENHRKRLEKTDLALRYVLRHDAQCYAAGIRPRLDTSRKVVAALEASQPAEDRRAALLHAVEARLKKSEQAEARAAGGRDGSREGLKPGRTGGLLPVGLRPFFQAAARFNERGRAVANARWARAAQPLGRA